MTTKPLSLKHEFSTEEINEIAVEMSHQINERNRVVVEKASAMKSFNGQLKYWETKINQNNELITDGYEYRDVTVEVEFNKPVNGQKMITRLDTEESWQEPMTLEEFDLFTIADGPVPSNPKDLLEEGLREEAGNIFPTNLNEEE